MLELIGRAAPPHERGGPPFVRCPGGDEDARIARWVEAVGVADEDALAALLRRHGLDVRAAVADVAVGDSERLPPWATALAAFLAAQRSTSEGAPVRRAHLAGVRAAAALLPPSPVPVTAAAHEQLAAQLGGRITAACARTLDAEVRLLPPGVPLDVSAGGWRQRFDRWPGLAYVVGTVCANWQASVEELFSRLAADLPLLVASLWDGEAPTELVGFQGDAGDPHNGGRSVALLEFSGGRRAVYKTKDLRAGAAFFELVARLDDDLKRFAILARDGYGWEEAVEHRPCDRPEQVARFYRRLGKLIRLLQLLEARDFWYDNLVAHGEHPVFVDFETLLQPRATAASAAAELVEESVVPTGALTLRVVASPGEQAEDIGALAPSRELATPFRFALHALFGEDGAPAVDSAGHVLWPPPPYAPVLAGATVGVDAYVEDLVDGYRDMHARLVGLREGLAGFRGLPVRVLLRDTFTCHRIIFAAGDPARLGDGFGRELALQRLLRTGDESVAWAEIESFRNLDVPLFLSRTDSHDLYVADRRIAERRFSGTAWERLDARVAALPAFPVETHVELLRAALAAGGHGSPPRAHDGDPVAIADDVLARALEEADGSLAWVGLTYDPFTNATRVEPLRPDLLTGTCGLAILFAETFAATGLDRFEDAARRTLVQARGFIRDAPAACAAAPAGWIVPCGGLLGVGAALYALARCARALGDRALAEEAAAGARALPFEVFGRRSPGGLVSGVAGLARAIDNGAVDLGPDDARLRSAVAQAGERPAPQPPGVELPRDVDADGEPPPWNLSILWGLPGVAHALLRRQDPGVGSVRELSPVGAFRA